MGIGKWIKRAVGGVEIVAGVATGNPMLVAQGAGMEASTLGGGSKGGGAASVPSSSRSIGQARSQDKARMKRSYGI